MATKSVKLGGLAPFLEEQDIVSLIRLNLILFIVTALVGITGFLVFRDAGWAHFSRNGFLLLAGSLLILFLLNQKRISLAAYSSLAIYGTILTYAAWTGAGVKGTMYSLFFLLVLGAGLLIGRRAGYVTAIIAVVLGLVLLLAGRSGLLVNVDRPSVDVAVWITLSACFLITAYLVSLVLKQAERAIAAAQGELDERIRVEMEVRRLNDELEQRVAERTAQLAAREAFLSGIFDSAGDAILTVDEAQCILSFSKSAEQIFGYSAAEIMGKPLDLLIPPKSMEVHRAHIRNFSSSSDLSRFMGTRRAVYGRRKDGTEFPAEASISKLMIDNRLVFTAFLWDVSERRRLEKALGEKEHRFRRVFEVSPVAIVITTLHDGRLVEANDAYWKLSGHEPQASIGMSTLELRTGYDSNQRQHFLNALLEKKSIRDPDYNFVDDDGNQRPTMAFYELIDLDGQPMILSMFYDMTEQVAAHNALQRSEERIRGLLNAIPETIFELSHDGVVLQYVPSDADSSPGTSADLHGKSIYEIMAPAVAGQIMFAVARTLESGQLHTIEYQQGGDDITYEARLTVSGSDSVMVMVRDISLHKQAEIDRERMIDELEIRNAESESLRETTVIVTSTLDISDAVQRILQQLKRVITYDSASVWLYKGTTSHLVGGDGIPDIPEADKHYTVAENEPDYPLWIRAVPYILLDDIQENYPQFREPPIHYIRSWMGIPLNVRNKLIGMISLDGKRVGQFTHENAQLALNFANQVSIAVENARLFSDLQNELLERQALIDELDSKNAELERFTYAVSHDLKSPLITIKGFVGFLKEDVTTGSAQRVYDDLQRIGEAIEKMQERLDDLLELSRAGRLTDKPEVIRFHDLAMEALKLVHGRISKAGIEVHVAENLASVTGDHHRLLEVVQNLIDNAAKFMGDQKHPRIEVGQHGQDTKFGQPVFFIQDNGMGIPPEQHERIFGIFNKLNPKAEGTGIGLALVKKIIESHGGNIWVESEVGLGSTFYFSLPGV